MAGIEKGRAFKQLFKYFSSPITPPNYRKMTNVKTSKCAVEECFTRHATFFLCLCVQETKRFSLTTTRRQQERELQDDNVAL